MNIETPNMIPKHLRGQVAVQTPGGISIDDIMLSREKDLADIRAITAEMERELKEHIDGGSKNTIKSCKGDMKKKKGLSQKEKKRRGKRKRQRRRTTKLEDGEKVFLKPRTSKIHYLEIVKEME